MEAEQIYEVVTKLIGNIRPQGCSQRDSESNKNLNVFIEVFAKMHQDIDDVAYDFSVATVRKGSREHGTGTLIFDGVENLRLDLLRSVLIADHPPGVHLYSDLNDYFKTSLGGYESILIKSTRPDKKIHKIHLGFPNDD